MNQRANRFDVCPRRNFRNYTAEASMLLGLGGQDERTNVEPFQDRNTRLVAAGLDPEDEWFGHAASLPRSVRIASSRRPYSSSSTSSAHMTMASSPA